jgi:hypothetical protein
MNTHKSVGRDVHEVDTQVVIAHVPDLTRPLPSNPSSVVHPETKRKAARLRAAFFFPAHYAASCSFPVGASASVAAGTTVSGSAPGLPGTSTIRRADR